ncbi:T9SS type A sorting domain-containing protein [Flagellimonas sp.]|uniref:T9SS type A sorting domain-containing protein n=1 Tax=Flagellimonas sp. TaxID=2058762 RepID=UPI003BAF2A74
MKKTYLLLMAMVLFLGPMANAQQRVLTKEFSANQIQEQKLRESIKDFTLVEIDLDQLNRDVATPQGARLLWNVNESMVLDMHVFPEEIRSPSFTATLVTDKGMEVFPMEKTITYKGYLSDGDAGHGVRLTIDRGFIHGSIQTDDGEIIVDQLKYMVGDHSLKSNQIVLYRSRDIIGTGGICGTQEELEGNKQSQPSITTFSNTTGCKVIEVALDCDGDYWDAYNDGSFNRMLSEINMIQDVYDSDLDAVMSVTSVQAFTGSGIYASSNPSTIMGEINTLWTSSPWSGISRDLVHHFTAKTTGIYGQASRIGAACDDANPRCFSEDRTRVHQTVAHEIGHLLNGRHSEGTDCGTPFVRSIMCQGDNKALEFSAASITRITNHMNNWSCLNNETIHIVGTSPICVNDTETFSLNNFSPTASTTITWSLSNSRASIQSGQGTSSVVIKGNSSGSVSLTATINYPGSSCGNLVETRSLKIGPTISYTWTGPGPYGQVDVNVTGGTAPWKFYKNGSTLIHTSYSSSTTVPFGCTGGSLEVRSTTSCGEGSYTDIIYGSCPSSFSFTVYPNPTASELKVSNVNPVGDGSIAKNNGSRTVDPVQLELYDFSGNLVKTMKYDQTGTRTTMDISTFKKGTYILKIVCRGVDESHLVVFE